MAQWYAALIVHVTDNKITEKQSGVAHFREVTCADQVFFCFQEEDRLMAGY